MHGKNSEKLKLCAKVWNYSHLYDVSLPLHSDEYDRQNSCWEMSVILNVKMETKLPKVHHVCLLLLQLKGQIEICSVPPGGILRYHA